MSKTDEDSYASGCYWSKTDYYDCDICTDRDSDFNDGYDHVSDEGKYYYVDEDGHKLVKKCIKCNTELSSVKSAHDYGNWTDNGELIHARNCIYCTARQEEGHNFGSDVAPYDAVTHACSCSDCGYLKKEYHSLSTKRIDSDEHGDQCAICKEWYNISGHSYERFNTVSSTCTKNGKVSFKCKKCTDSYAQRIPALGHAFQEDTEYKDLATCTEDGILHYTCGLCGETKTETIKALGHNIIKNQCVNYARELEGFMVEYGHYYADCCTRCRYEENIGERIRDYVENGGSTPIGGKEFEKPELPRQ